MYGIRPLGIRYCRVINVFHMMPWLVLCAFVFAATWLPGLLSLFKDETNALHLVIMVLGLGLSGLSIVPIFLLANLNRQLEKSEPKSRKWQCFWSIIFFFLIPGVGTFINAVALYFMFFDVATKAAVHATSIDRSARKGCMMGLVVVAIVMALSIGVIHFQGDLIQRGLSLNYSEMRRELEEIIRREKEAIMLRRQPKPKVVIEKAPISILEAVRRRNIKSVRTFIRQGDDINQRNRMGETPLMEAAAYGFLDVVQVLIEQGARLDLRNEHGESALKLARINMREDVVAYLEEKGAPE